MATTNIKYYSNAPYYDDYNETKNYHRILFRPGYAVQARELTQMQTALQAQIDRFGQYAFKHGSRVVGGKVTVNTEYDFIKIDSSFTHSTAGALNTDSYLEQFVGTTITGANNTGSAIKAKVIDFVAASDGDPNTLYIKYINSGGTDRDVSTFATGEEFQSDGSIIYYGKVQSTGTPVGKGSSANIEEGVYFISGTFAYVPAETLILDKYDNTPSYTVGLSVSETVVDSGVDISLKDNATGTPNTNAPGATRYKISTSIIKESLVDLNDENSNYITLLRIDNGIVQVDKTDATNNNAELSKRLARRTYEESGNYAIKPYQLDIKEHLDDEAGNGGYLTSANGGDDDKLAIGIEPSVSYVQGFRNENIATQHIVIDKPRDDANSINVDANTNVATPLGNYIKLTEGSIKGAPDITNFTTMTLYDATNGGGSTVGTARAKAMEEIGGEIRLHLFDINMTSGAFSAVRSVEQPQTGSIDFEANISDSTAIRYDNANNTSVFKLPYDAIKTLYNGVTNTTEYTVKKDFSATVTSNQCTISLASGEGHFTNINSATMISVGATAINTNPSFVGSPNDGVTTLTFSVTADDDTDVRILADVEVDGSDKAQKVKTRENDHVASSVSITSGYYSLGKADIIRIVSIVDSTSTNVTERFTLDNGQRDNFYDIGRITQKPGTSPVQGALDITFDYYTHGTGDYFTVDSYPPADYAHIPTFSSAQGELQLRDCVDFRPRKADDGANFTGTGRSLSCQPDPSHAMSMYIKYYMPRIDKLYITKEGEFKTVTGVASDNPTSPETPADAMALYDIRLNPYVFTTDDVLPTIINNKRYTMRDIGSIDKRVKNLEYYTSLSLLEQQASNTQLFDSSNFSRTKNGFLVDNFVGHSVGDVSNPDYQVSMDKGTGTLRPMFDERNVNLIRKAEDTGAVVKHQSLCMLPHTSNNYINQPYSSIAVNVNPYNVFTWSGMVKLSPESDEWKETDVRPDVIINDESNYDQFLDMAEEQGILGTVWNEWETNWTGVETDVIDNRNFWSGRRLTTTTATTVTEHQSRTGTRTSIASDTITRESGSKVVEVNFVPFMRSRKIYFKAELLKPNTKVYPFFNDISVASYCKSESFQEFSERTSVNTYEGKTTHPDGTNNLISDSNGTVEGSFVIPRNDILKFKTGVRTFKLTDSAANNTNDGSETTFAETQFHAEGLIESVQKEIISTKVPRLVTTELNDNRTLVDTTVETTVRWVDPLAQTFLVDTEGGIFCKSLDLYFKKKDANIPVRVSIRSVENGIPTQKIVPGADAVIYPSNVYISNDASSSTTITFDHPIYLAQNQEYAIVIMAQSNNYEAWVAEMGGFDKTNPNNRITKQPYGGVFFTSQNASTWTPEQSRDLKFSLNKCVFSNSGSEITLVHDTIPHKLLGNNSLVSTDGSGVVKVFHKNHGMHNANNPVVNITGAVAFNGLTATNLNGTHNITNVTHDTYDFTAANSNTANATGSGGGDVIYATENRQIDVLRPVIQELTVPGTRIEYYMTPYSETEVASGEAQVLANQNVIFAAPKSIASDQNSSTNKTFSMRCKLFTDKDTLSPIIDMNRTSLFTIQNRIIDNDTGNELLSTGGNQLARYITKKVELAEEADKIDVFLNINKPRSANVDLYWRVTEGGSSTEISDVNWSLATPIEAIEINDNPTVFKEVQYEIDPSGSFGNMQFKIVLRSTNSATVPLVKDFRAIAST